ncbi:helix-turn-helix domain-containing protein, partial [Streptomyces sp. T-3]|nr:helix-turn-helix domain-containing protein [Streptomyces sp. T-3]
MRTRKLPNDRLRALMAEAGLSGAELARVVNALGAELGFSVSYDRSTVSHWLTGTRPRPPAGQLLAGVFSRRLERAVGGFELGLSDVGQGAFPVGGSACRPADGCACATDSARGLTELLGRHQDPVELRRMRQLAYRRVQPADLVGEGGAGAGRG